MAATASYDWELSTWPTVISSAGRNAFDGFTPSVPDGTKLDYGSQAFQEREDAGEIFATRIPVTASVHFQSNRHLA